MPRERFKVMVVEWGRWEGCLEVRSHLNCSNLTTKLSAKLNSSVGKIGVKRIQFATLEVEKLV